MMLRYHRLFGGLALLSTAAFASAQDPSFLDWTIDITGPKLMSAASVLLKNLTKNAYIRPTQQVTYGINLMWQDEASMRAARRPAIRFELANPGMTTPKSGPIQFGQPVALYLDKGYLKYQKRTFGVNLDFSNKPAYEWELIGLGRQADEVIPHMKVALLNTVAKTFLIYDSRKGIDVRWWKFMPSLPKNAVTQSNPAFRNYRATEPELRQFLTQLQSVNPGEASFLITFFGVK